MKLHYKLFKAGKQLVNAPIGKLALTSAVLFTVALGGVNAYADTSDTSPATAQTSSSSNSTSTSDASSQSTATTTTESDAASTSSKDDQSTSGAETIMTPTDAVFSKTSKKGVVSELDDNHVIGQTIKKGNYYYCNITDCVLKMEN